MIYPVNAETFEPKLIDWYAAHKRSLPWRLDRDPYRILISEFMLQQTTVATVIPYFLRWMETWPQLKDFANATEQEVLFHWQGLGYYARARNLLKAAQRIQEQHAGQIPSNFSQLSQLPGIGPYTAAAVAAIAFDIPVIPIDGNVARILSRHDLIPLTSVLLKAYLAKNLTYFPQHPRDLAQALMDLGACICRPKTPTCIQCPLQETCRAFQLGRVAEFPVSSPRRDLPQRYAWAFIIKNNEGALFLRQRPNKGLLASLMEVPSTPWRDTPWSEAEAMRESPVTMTATRYCGEIVHTFTHFRLTVQVMEGKTEFSPPVGFWTHSPQDFALPTLVKKALRKANVF